MGHIRLLTEIPGPASRAFMERRRRVVSSGVGTGKAGIAAACAEGALVTDLDGNTFIDFTGGIGCLNAGHSAARVVEAVQAQVARLQHACFQVTMYEPYVALAERLVDLVPGPGPKKVALFNSGAEAVENAVKIARRATGRTGIVCFENAFHGRTLLTMSMTSKVRPYRDGFGPFAPEVYLAPFPYPLRRPAGLSEPAYVEDCIRRLHAFFRATVTPDQVAAVVMEPVMGEGGFLVPPPRFVEAVVQVCRDHGILFVADEIQSGFGRTGRMFGIEHFGVEPDLVTLAKSLSAGFPLSAVVGRAQVMDAVPAGGLGGTFGGNPVCAAAALAAVDAIVEGQLPARAQAIGERVRSRLEPYVGTGGLAQVRGLGAMIGLEFLTPDGQPDKARAEAIVGACASRGLLLLTAGLDGNVIRTLMPLVVTDAQLEEALDVWVDVFLGR